MVKFAITAIPKFDVPTLCDEFEEPKPEKTQKERMQRPIGPNFV